jgi:hypothetical protein
VETKIILPHYAGDADISNRFPGCLFALDALADLKKENPEKFRRLVLMDNDCLARMPADPMRDLPGAGGGLWGVPENYPTTLSFNGQSRASLTLAAGYISGAPPPTPIPLYGGEFYSFDPAALGKVCEVLERVWGWIRSEGRESLGPEWTEEHVLSLAIFLAGLDAQDARPWIRRIWTLENYFNVLGNEDSLALWHLPGEKRRAFQHLFRKGDRLGWKPFPSLGELQTFLKTNVSLQPGRFKKMFRKAGFRMKRAVAALRSAP